MLKGIKGGIVSLDKFINSGFNVVSKVGIAPFELIDESSFTDPIMKEEGDIFDIVLAGSSNVVDS